MLTGKVNTTATAGFVCDELALLAQSYQCLCLQSEIQPTLIAIAAARDMALEIMNSHIRLHKCLGPHNQAPLASHSPAHSAAAVLT